MLTPKSLFRCRSHGPGKRMSSQLHKQCSLLLAASSSLGLLLAARHLAQHHNTVTVHESDTRKALAILEAVAHQRLLRLEAALRHLVGLQGVGILHLLATSFLAHLPDELGDAACGSAATHEADWRVSSLDLVRDIEHLDLGVELFRLAQGRVLLVDHDVTRARHVLLVQTLDVEADVVAWVREVDTLVVHLNGEHFASAWIRRSVCGQEDDLLARLHHALLNTACEHIADTLNLVDT